MPKVNGKLATYAIAGLVLVFVANFIAVRFSGYPFAYCLVGPYTGAAYAEWAQPVNVVLLVAVMVCLFRQKYLNAAKVAVLMVLLGGLPAFAETAFKMGGACYG